MPTGWAREALHDREQDAGGSGLDICCVGPAINLAARTKKMMARLRRTHVGCLEFARLMANESESSGAFEITAFEATTLSVRRTLQPRRVPIARQSGCRP